jgi:hypothetical protein
MANDQQGEPNMLPDKVHIRGSDVKIENVWQEKVLGGYVQAYAGSLAKDSTQGIVIVLSESPGLEGGRFLTPQKSGAVRIVEADGFRLVLQANGGETYYFDIPSLSFVSSLDEIVPTATPLPYP